MGALHASAEDAAERRAQAEDEIASVIWICDGPGLAYAWPASDHAAMDLRWVYIGTVPGVRPVMGGWWVHAGSCGAAPARDVMEVFRLGS